VHPGDAACGAERGRRQRHLAFQRRQRAIAFGAPPAQRDVQHERRTTADDRPVAPLLQRDEQVAGAEGRHEAVERGIRHQVRGVRGHRPMVVRLRGGFLDMAQACACAAPEESRH